MVGNNHTSTIELFRFLLYEQLLVMYIISDSEIKWLSEGAFDINIAHKISQKQARPP